ncbi:PorP/SprF family type IX secretion system membrane protein [Echinicola pacifica]|uniref:PorP/SprF family type IX secretion system membrane protein n=1 Tax=Echinicola pacifica TaxID=346377 RepID=UPI00036B7EB1|nr:type IX secretion system membrane protein PorP/SprF [Echinicola pacifica]
MKNIAITIICLLLVGPISAVAQSRKYVSQFSFFQSYFNPGLTGYEGSTIRGFVRNQWGGYEGAPKSAFVSAELDFAEMKGQTDPALLGKNAASLNLFYDSYGAFRETSLVGGYASRVRISQKHNLRLGAGVSYTNVRLDGGSMTTEQQNDGVLSQYIGGFSNMQIVDFNLGLALTHANYYLSYAMHGVNSGRISSGDDFLSEHPVSYIVQAGYREALTKDVSVIGNVFYRAQEGYSDNIEFNLKALLMDKIWLGAGHRIDYANSLQMGIVLQKMKFGYVYETPTNKSYLLPSNTHEFVLIYNLFKVNKRSNPKEVLIW